MASDASLSLDWSSELSETPFLRLRGGPPATAKEPIADDLVGSGLEIRSKRPVRLP